MKSIKVVRRKKKFYSEEEDNIILEYVDKYGENPETFRKICGVLKRERWDHIQGRYDRIISKVKVHDSKNKKIRKLKIQSKRKKFSKEEDEVILEYTKRYGPTIETFKKVSLALNRNRYDIIRTRFEFLISKDRNEKQLIEKKLRNLSENKWNLSEQETLIEFMIKVRTSAHT